MMLKAASEAELVEKIERITGLKVTKGHATSVLDTTHQLVSPTGLVVAELRLDDMYSDGAWQLVTAGSNIYQQLQQAERGAA